MRYFVFARREYDQPVARQGVIDAGDADAAAAHARERYGDWLEVRLVPEESIQWIVGPLPAERLRESEREQVTA
jgi:1,2-phenylacetyl-CoA epoxidase PaaB subunit